MVSGEDNQGSNARTRKGAAAVLAALALVMAVLGVTRPASADDVPSIRVDMGMADPGSYDHAVGGGAWGDGRSGAPGDVGNEYQWSHYACGDIVSFLALFTADTTEGSQKAPRTVDLHLAFDAATSGQPGAGYTDIVAVSVVGGDPANVGDGESTARLMNETLTDPYQPGGKLTGTVRVDDIEPGDQIVVRVDVRVTCLAGALRGGILYGVATGASEVTPVPRDLGVGQMRQQLIQVNSGTGDEVTGTPLSVTKTPSVSAISADRAPVDFTIVVSNRSTGTALTLDGLVDNVLGDVTATSDDVTDTDCELPSLLAPGTAYRCSFTGVVHATASSPHHNTITASAGPVSATASATVTRQLAGGDNGGGPGPGDGQGDQPGLPAPRLGLSAEVQPPGPAHGGDTLTVPVTVTNLGDEVLTNVHITESRLGLDTTLPSLAVHESQTVSATYVVTDADVAARLVTFDPSATSDQTMLPVAQHLAVEVVASAKLTLSNVPSTTLASVGDVVTFTLTVANTGGEDLTNVRVLDALLDIDQTIPSLPIGQSQVLTGSYTATVADAQAGRITNPAQATSDQTGVVEATARVDVRPFTANVLDIRTGGSGTLPFTGGRTESALWLAAALATAGAAYLTAGRKPRRVTSNL
jgi:hypothetical protein